MALERRILIKVDSAKAERNVSSLDGKMQRLGSTADSNEQKFSKLKGAVVAVAAALQARKIQQYSDAFTSAQNQIRQTTKTTSELVARTDELLKVSQRSRVGISETAELYTNLVLSTENLNLTTAEQIRLTETISKSFAVSGKSAAESAGAIRQLGQAFASGALRGDEFNSIAEGAPEIMRALQRSLSMTQGELREFAATGGITAEVLVNALGGASDVIDQKLAKSQKTFAQFATEAENNAIQFVGSSDLITNSVNIAGEALVGLSNNIEALSKLIIVAAAAGFASLTAGIILNTAETVRNTFAKTANAAASKTLSTFLGVQTAATARSTVAIRASTVAAGAFRGALALLGGPAGAVAVAGASILLFDNGLDKVNKKIKAGERNVKALTAEFSGLGAQIISEKVEEVESEMAGLSPTIERLRNDFKTANESMRDSAKLMALDIAKQLQAVTDKYDELAQKRKALLSVEAERQSNEIVSTGFGVKEDSTQKVRDSFKNTEKANTESLRLELQERLKIKRLFNEIFITEDMSFTEKEKAIAEFNRDADIIRAKTDFEREIVALNARAQAIKENTKTTEAEKIALQSEINMQKELQEQLHQERLIAIKGDASDRIKEIEREETEYRAMAQMRAAEITTQANAASVSDVLGFLEQFSSKSKVLAKGLLIVRAAEGVNQAIINSQIAATRALAELGPIAGPPAASAMITYGKVSAGIIAANAALKLGGAGGGGGGGSISLGSGSQQTQAQRQEPISQQLVVENRGLGEVLQELRNRDPQEPIPLEFALRIAAAQEDLRRISGE